MTTEKVRFTTTGGFDLKAVEVALYEVIESEDADLAAQIEAPEDGGPSRFPALAQIFVRAYLDTLALGAPRTRISESGS